MPVLWKFRDSDGSGVKVVAVSVYAIDVRKLKSDLFAYLTLGIVRCALCVARCAPIVHEL